jgi:hypothetical protein
MPLVVDHILAEARGGSDEFDNLCAACYRCNEYKGARSTGRDPVTSIMFQFISNLTTPYLCAILLVANTNG